MKEKYIGTLENLFGETTYLYTYADSIEKAKKNLEYQKSQKGELGMFKFMKVEKEIKDDTSKEETIKEEEIQDKPELEELVEYDGYYVSNMGKVFMKIARCGRNTGLKKMALIRKKMVEENYILPNNRLLPMKRVLEYLGIEE